MLTINKKIKKGLLIGFGAGLAFSYPAWAESDMHLMEKALKAREHQNQKGVNHSSHTKVKEATAGFRGVFYGYLPCQQKDCSGVKMTLSLKNKNNYLLVTQYAKASNREYFEKGKYDWDDSKNILLLTPKKNAAERRFRIRDDATLIQLNSDGSAMPGPSKNYQLRRSDQSEAREVHIH